MNELQTLITEKAKDVTVELSSLFEGLELSDEIKENLQTTFDTAIKTTSVQLVESVLAEREAQIEEKYIQEAFEIVDEIKNQHEEKFNSIVESTELYLEEFTKDWLKNNKLAVDNTIKAKLFDSLFESLSNVFVEHNLNVPTEEIQVMDELQEEVYELQNKVDELLKERKDLQNQVKESEIKEVIQKLTENLTQSQIEKVAMLSESIVIDDNVEQKLRTIVRMVEASSDDKDNDDDKDNEADKKQKKAPSQQVNENLNYTENRGTKPSASVNPTIQTYLNFAR